MGVHDFVCFVQRNDQSLIPCVVYDEVVDSGEDEASCDEFGEGEATIVLVPKKVGKKQITVEQIALWNLNRFKDYQTLVCEYDWDKLEFSNYPGYSDVLTDAPSVNGDSNLGNGLHSSIWDSSEEPEYHLVNFSTNAYNAFVLNQIEPNLIATSYYNAVFINRGEEQPFTYAPYEHKKSWAFEKIVNNKWSH